MASRFGDARPDAKRLLLHICCGACATHVIDLLKNEYYLIGIFYNPNIDTLEEFFKRLDASARVCTAHSMMLWVPPYLPQPWINSIKGMELEPEGGKRCATCFHHRLEYTARTAHQASIPVFTTTLTVSPHKNSHIINKIGDNLSSRYDVSFLSHDFKKKDGYKQSVQKSKELGLYRQNYCGCSFSRS